MGHSWQIVPHVSGHVTGFCLINGQNKWKILALS